MSWERPLNSVVLYLIDYGLILCSANGRAGYKEVINN